MGLLKTEVNYKISKKKALRCQNCDYFIRNGSCEVVDGNISPDGVCDRWYLPGKNEPKGAEFYKKQARRSKNATQKSKADPIPA